MVMTRRMHGLTTKSTALANEIGEPTELQQAADARMPNDGIYPRLSGSPAWILLCWKTQVIR